MTASVRDIILQNYQNCDGTPWLTLYPEGQKKIELYTYREVVDRAKCWSHLYAQQGLEPGDTILISLPTSIDLYASHIGALLSGIIPTIFTFPNIKTNRELFLESLLSSLENYDYAAFVTTEGYDFKDVVCPFVNTITLKQLDLNSSLDAPIIEPQDPVIHQYSSGTTGIKKRLPLTHSQLVEFLNCYYETLCIEPQIDKIQSWLPLYHDMGFIACYMLPLLKGIKLVSLSAQDWVVNPQRFWRLCESHKSTLIWQPNFAFGLYANTLKPDESYKLGHVKSIISSSETTRKHTIETFFTKYRPFGLSWEKFANCFGLAEHTYAATQTPFKRGLSCVSLDKKALDNNSVIRVVPDKPDSVQVISCGVPLPGVDVKIKADEGHDVGDILINSNFRFDGYSKCSQSESYIDQDGWFNTRDCGFIIDNELFILGRTDDIIICNGENFYPEDLEEITSSCDGVISGRCAAIVDTQAQSETDVVIVFAEIKVGACPTSVKQLIERKIRAAFSALLFEVSLVEPKSLLKSSSGKISRKRVKQQYLNKQLTYIDTDESATAQVPLSQEDAQIEMTTEQLKIYQCLEEVLDSKAINRDCDTDLIETGVLDSLTFVSLIVHLEVAFSIRISDLDTSALEQFRTINSIAAFVRRIQSGKHSNLTRKRTFNFRHITPVVRQQGVTPISRTNAQVPAWFEDVKAFTDASVSQKATIPGKGSGAAKNFSSPSLNTDDQGFRITSGNVGPISLDEFTASARPKVLLMGASSLFGVGVNDHQTIASYLSQLDDEKCYFNGAARGADLATEMHLCNEFDLAPGNTVLSFSCGNDFRYFTDELYAHHSQPNQSLMQTEVLCKFREFEQGLFEKILSYRDLVIHQKKCQFLLSLQVMRPFCSPTFDVGESQHSEAMRAALGWRYFRRNFRAYHFFWELQHSFRENIMQFCFNNNIPYYDPNPDFIEPKQPSGFEDYWHYNNSGSLRVAQLLLPFINTKRT
ncbi:non-ribosomal peptide synthetase [Alteromonas facilis]|uniref:non-ribosomal peptide synthetase n=1 Tax=Alteromonas facilis TaxID=2048004 RepID=UPI000C28281C|nr:AMP-binding protein [Alteromonas facilis]